MCCRGARRSPMMFSCVFAASHKVWALLFSAGSLSGTLQAGFSLSCRVFHQFGGLREACRALFVHRGFARAHICASWRRQTTNSEANGVTKSICPFLQELLFGQLFVTFSYVSELCDFVKTELPCGRELDFECPGRSKCHILSFGAPSKNLKGPGGSCQGGGGTPEPGLKKK